VKFALALLVVVLVFADHPATASPTDCARCHPAETARFGAAGMTKAMRPGSADLNTSGAVGPYRYAVADSRYTVSDGVNRVEFPIAWTFGEGSTGQTWVYRDAGVWHESRASYFATIKSLDITIGQQSITPHGLSEAAGRELSASEARQCFGCHATGEVPGIQCERCHQAAEAHLKNVAEAPRSLAKLTTEEMSDFCGACHRTWSQIAINGPHGPQNVRFQPYRLEGSKCYDAADTRIRCTACHNPHEPLETKLIAYDSKCMACHSSCRAGNQKECVTCHMPAVELPGAHKTFKDHRIRIVRPNEAYPD
jgi:hypothetical protein